MPVPQDETDDTETLCQRPVLTDAQIAAIEASNALLGMIKKNPTWDDFIAIQQNIAEMNDIVVSCSAALTTMTNNWNSLPPIPSALSQLTNDTGFVSASAVASAITAATVGFVNTSAMNAAITAATSGLATSSALSTGLAGKLSTPSGNPATQYLAGDGSVANMPTMPSVAKASSALTLALSGSGATGTQIHATKDAEIGVTYKTSTTVTLAGNNTSMVQIKVCATNSAVEGDWAEFGRTESDQPSGISVVIGQVVAQVGQIVVPVPAGWYVKAVASGTGTHTEAAIGGWKTIYG